MRKGIAPGHLGRYRQIARILAEEGLGAVAIRIGLPGALRSPRGEPRDATTPERIRRALERLGPAFVKVGQMLSTRADLVPEEYRIELKRLQDHVAPIPFEDVAAVIEAEFGPPDTIFARFDREPLAAASIGQVHAARLKEGDEVVVKVQRPGILAQVEMDLDIMRTQARRIQESGIIPPAIDASEIAEELSDAVLRELDYLVEAESIERFRTAFAADPVVVIPRVYRDYSCRRTLTMERLHGIPLNRLDLIDEARLDRKELASRGVTAYLQQVFEIGMFHADPHPGNIFALPQGRIGFTDFGRVGEVDAGVGDTATDLLLAIVDRDSDLAADALLDISNEPALVDVERLGRELSMLIGKYHGAELGHFRVGEVLDDMLDLVRQQQLGLPSELVLLLGTMALLESLGQDLDPTFDFVEVARPFASDMQRRQLQPDELSRKFTRTARRWVRTATELPHSIERSLRRVAEGELRIAVRPEGYERFLDRAEELVDRLAFAVLIASFVIGFSTLLGVERMPRWITVMLTLGLVSAVGVSAWMFTSLLLARWRSRG